MTDPVAAIFAAPAPMRRSESCRRMTHRRGRLLQTFSPYRNRAVPDVVGTYAKEPGGQRTHDRLAEIESQQAIAAQGSALEPFASGRAPADVWKRLSIDRRHAGVRELMIVTLLPTGRIGNQFDPESVRIDWRA